jgi:hypothetical protein
MSVPARPPIVFVHGIKGGNLRGPDGDLRWMRVRDLFVNRDRGLASPLEWKNGEQAQDGVYSDGPLRGVLWKPIYRRFLDGMERLGWNIFSYRHDWRRSQSELSAGLIEFLGEIREKYAAPLLVSHSNGGMIVDHALRTKGVGEVAGVLHAGVPFGDGVSFLPDMTNGEAVIRNTHLAGPFVHLSWASPWAYFPIGDQSRLLDENGGHVPHDWTDVVSWKGLGLGPFSLDVELSEIQIEHLRCAMQAAAIVRANIEAGWPNDQPRPPIAVLRSRSQDTPSAYQRRGDGVWELDSPVCEVGDGRILFNSAIPPFDIEADYETKFGHGSLLDDIHVVDAALRELLTLPQIPASL